MLFERHVHLLPQLRQVWQLRRCRHIVCIQDCPQARGKAGHCVTIVSMGNITDNWGIIGHEWAVHLLAARIASGRVAHAYLFTGPPQVGKTTLAIRLAQALNCIATTPPCGVCRPCDLIGRALHPDVQVIEPVGRAIHIEAIRTLQSTLSLLPFEAPHRIAIILNIEKATDQAADALLKTLEEPPSTTHLLLTAESAEMVRPTIVSRCHTIALRPVGAAPIERALTALGASPDEAHTLARLSGGRPGWALTAFRQPEVLTMRARIVEEMLQVLYTGRAGRFDYSEQIAEQDALPLILEIWQSWWRDVLLLAEGSAVEPVNVDYGETLRDLARRIAPQQARDALRAVRRTMDALERNANTRLALDVMLLDMPFLSSG